MTTQHAACWKGEIVETFPTHAEAETFIGIEKTQMELAEYTPEELQENWEIREVAA